jgi:hypothetical protein
MNKLDEHVTSFTQPSSITLDETFRRAQSEQSRRLIVLVPEEADFTTITRRIWELANTSGSIVQLLGLCKDTSAEMTLRRKLVTVSALIQAARIPVEIKVEIGSNWLNAVKCSYQEGDAIVCITDRFVGFPRKPLSQILESAIKGPVYVLSGIQSPKHKKNILAGMIAAWSGFIGIMIGFFLIQVKIMQVSKDGFQTLILLLLLIPEFWLIKVWNSLFS